MISAGGLFGFLGNLFRGGGSSSRPQTYQSPYQQEYEQAARGPLLGAASAVGRGPAGMTFADYMRGRPQQFRAPSEEASQQAGGYMSRLQQQINPSFQFHTPQIRFADVPQLQGLGDDYYRGVQTQAMNPILRGQTASLQALERMGAGSGMGRSGMLASQVANIGRGTEEQLAGVGRDVGLERMRRDYEAASRARDLGADIGSRQAELENQTQGMGAQYDINRMGQQLNLGRLLAEREGRTGEMSLNEQQRMMQELGGERDYQSNVLQELLRYMRPEQIGSISQQYGPGLLRRPLEGAIGGLFGGLGGRFGGLGGSVLTGAGGG